MKSKKEIEKIYKFFIASQDWLQFPQYEHALTIIDTLSWVLDMGDTVLFEDIIEATKEAKP